MKVRGWAGLGLLLVSGVAFAATTESEMRKQLEASMLVTGTVEVDTHGKLRSLSLSQEDSLPPGVVRVIRNSALHWRFQPVVIDGKPVTAKTDVSLRVIAQPLPDNQFQIRVGGAMFGIGAPNPNETLRADRLRPPDYPAAAARTNAGGTVYLVLKVGRNGKVEDAVAEQVNLRVVGTEKEVEILREMFAKNALQQGRRWRFIPPTEGPEAGAQFWSARVPVIYSMRGTKQPVYGQWEAYLPGPRQQLPWQTHDEGPAFSPDAAPEGSVRLAGSGLKLLTAPGG